MKTMFKAWIVVVPVAIFALGFFACDNPVDPKVSASDTVISIAAIPGIGIPSAGGIPAETVDTAQYSGTVAWEPKVSGTFAAETRYTATITLTAKDGFTLQGVEANFFTVEGAEATNAANSGIVSAVFLATGSPLIADYTITGSGTALTLSKGSQTMAVNQPIQTLIEAIRSDAAGANIVIQFGSGNGELLDIGAGAAGFNNTGSGWTWGSLITLSGGITSSINTAVAGTIFVTGAVSINSAAIIANTGGVNGRAINHSGTGTITISGGAVSAATGRAVQNSSSGTVNISGGTVSATTGTAILNDGIIWIGGGTVSVSGGNPAIQSENTGSSIVLSGNPSISGRIRLSQWTLGVANSFAPSPDRKYTLDFNSYGNGMVAVIDGADYASHFELYNIPGLVLSVSGSNLTVVIENLNHDYTITSNGMVFQAVRGDIFTVATTQSIQAVIDIIKTDAAGADIKMQFGSVWPNNILNIGNASISFNNTDGEWGLITLHGSITSSNAVTNEGTIVISNSVSVNSDANIANTATVENGRAINHMGTGIVVISSGEVSATTGIAVWNQSTGRITVSGTAMVTSANVTSSAGTIVLNNNGTTTDARLEITGGTVRNTATVTNSRTIYNASPGAVDISGGVVSATTGRAILNRFDGKITISGTAMVTSANVTSNAGTIFLDLYEPVYAVQLEITGGTVRNTADNANSRTIFNNSIGTVNISGGEVSATTGVTVWNQRNGLISVSGTAMVTSNSVDGGTIVFPGIYYETGIRLLITGGTVRNTAGNENSWAIINHSSGGVRISGGTVGAMNAQGVGTIGTAIWNNHADGTINISQANPGIPTLITSANSSAAEGTIRVGPGSLIMSGGRVENTYTNSNARSITADNRNRVSITGGEVVPEF